MSFIQTSRIIHDTTKSYAAWIAFVMVCVLIGLYYMRSMDSTKAAEKNVGGQGGMDNFVQKSKKPHQCYKDSDCPDHTSCNSDGLCVPRLAVIPTTRGEAGMSRGRETEKGF